MRKVVLYGIIFFQIILIISLVRGIQLSRKASERIEGLEATKAKLQEEAEKIRQEGEYVKSEYYLEKVAREELNLSKPGESVVIIPEGVINENKERKEANAEEERENWQKWWGVLSGQD